MNHRADITESNEPVLGILIGPTAIERENDVVVIAAGARVCLTFDTTMPHLIRQDDMDAAHRLAEALDNA